MSLIAWEIDLNEYGKHLRLVFDKVTKVSTDSNNGIFVVRVDMADRALSKLENDIAHGKLDAGQ